MVCGTPFLLDVIFKLEIGNWHNIGGYGTGPYSLHHLHYGHWISQLLQNCFAIVAKPAPAGEDVPDLGPGGSHNAFRKGLQTFSERLVNIFRKTCERVLQGLRKKFCNTALLEKIAKPNFAMISIELRRIFDLSQCLWCLSSTQISLTVRVFFCWCIPCSCSR
jgi:hypothetical protein